MASVRRNLGTVVFRNMHLLIQVLVGRNEKKKTLIPLPGSAILRDVVDGLKSECAPDSPSFTVCCGSSLKSASTKVSLDSTVSILDQYDLTCVVLTFASPPPPVREPTAPKNAFAVMMRASSIRESMPDPAEGFGAPLIGVARVVEDLKEALLKTTARFTREECRDQRTNPSKAQQILKTFANVIWALDGQ